MGYLIADCQTFLYHQPTNAFPIWTIITVTLFSLTDKHISVRASHKWNNFLCNFSVCGWAHAVDSK